MNTVSTSLQSSLDAAVEAYRTNRGRLIDKAMERGSQAVIELEQAYQDLRDAQWEVARLELRRNDERYEQLAKEAGNASKAINASINTLNDIADVIGKITKLVNLVGRLLVLV